MDKRSSLLPILLHGFFLVSVNLFSVMVAFVIIMGFSSGDDKIVHASLALILNVIVYLAVYSLMNQVEPAIMKINNWSMLMAILMVSLAILPIVYYPVFYFIHGDWSPFDNLMAIWPYQVIVNGLCLVLNFFVVGKTPSR